MEERRCVGCGREIPALRIEILPNTDHCVTCSSERARTEDELPVDGADLGDLAKMVQCRPNGG